MKFIVARKEFADALKIVLKAVAVKAQTPILSGIYLKADGSTLEMQATDHTICIKTKIPAVAEENGETVILGKKLFEIVQKLTGDTLTISTAENFAEIRSAGSKFKLLVCAAEDFPKMQAEENLQTFTFRQWQMKKMLKETVFAAAKEGEGRPVFEGVFFHFNGEKLRMAATNTHRLAVTSTDLASPFDGEKKFLVPAKTLEEVEKLLFDGTLKVTFSNRTATFDLGNVLIVTRLISGDFPNFDRLLHEEKTIFARTNSEELLSALERISVIAKDTEYQTVTLHFSDGGIEIKTRSAEIGEADERVVAVVEGGDLDISFNYKYLIDVLKAAEGKVTIGLSEKLKPIDFHFDEEKNFVYIVTPVRTV